MLYLLPVLLILLLTNAPLVMDAVSRSCALFVHSVLPGLFPYLTLSLMLVSRLPQRVPDGVLLLLGWGGGSPTGARLLWQRQTGEARQRRFLAVACQTMSPMFLLGTVPRWTGRGEDGACLLAAALLGGLLAGWLARLVPDRGPEVETSAREALAPSPSAAPLALGEAIEAASHTMLLVCGSMAVLRVAAEAVDCLLPVPAALRLALITALEVTCGAERIAALSLPPPLRTALLAGATGFGGMAIVMQNRSVLPKGLLSLPRQLVWQMAHGVLSFLLALACALLWP